MKRKGIRKKRQRRMKMKASEEDGRFNKFHV